jgi:hypothetical protein
MEVHRLRKNNAAIRDDYSRLLKRFQETQEELEITKRDKAQAELLK